MSPRGVAPGCPGQLEIDFTTPTLTDDQRAELSAQILPGWTAMGACSSASNDGWFPETGRDLLKALTTCAECPVRRSCLASALANEEEHGVWGGRTEVELYTIRQRIFVGVPIRDAIATNTESSFIPGNAA